MLAVWSKCLWTKWGVQMWKKWLFHFHPLSQSERRCIWLMTSSPASSSCWRFWSSFLWYMKFAYWSSAFLFTWLNCFNWSLHLWSNLYNSFTLFFLCLYFHHVKQTINKKTYLLHALSSWDKMLVKRVDLHFKCIWWRCTQLSDFLVELFLFC